MAGSSGVGRVYGGSSGGVGAVMLQNQRLSSSSSQPLESFFISGSSSSFLGSSSMVSFEDVCGRKRSESSFFRTYDQEDNVGDEDFEDYFHQPEKKRRLTIEQVRFLEKSFESENKLEPERKVQLAKELGLQPRQVAIWFQNRRARWKTKQLEKDFDILQASYNNLKADYDTLLKEKEQLQAEVVHLTDKLHLKEKRQEDHSKPPNTYSEVRLVELQEPIVDSASESDKHHSAKSDVLDSDSTHHGAGGYSSLGELGDSSYAFEADHSDISQDDEDYLSKSLLPSSHAFSKIEDVDYPQPPSHSGNFELPSDDHASLLWPYWDINLKM